MLVNLDGIKVPIHIDESEPIEIILDYEEDIKVNRADTKTEIKEIVSTIKLPYEIKSIDKFYRVVQYNRMTLEQTLNDKSNSNRSTLGYFGSGTLNECRNEDGKFDHHGLYYQLGYSDSQAINVHDNFIVIRDERLKYSMFAAIPHKDIVNIKNVPSEFCHEVIHGEQSRKLAFDIDFECSHDEAESLQNEVISLLRESIKYVFNRIYHDEIESDINDNDIVFMSSCGPKNDHKYKISYHILVAPDKYACLNANENKEFAELVKCKLPKYKDIIDMCLSWP